MGFLDYNTLFKLLYPNAADSQLSNDVSKYAPTPVPTPVPYYDESVLPSFSSTDTSVHDGPSVRAIDDGPSVRVVPTDTTTFDTVPTNPTPDGGGMSEEQLAILQWLADLQTAQLEGTSLRNQGQTTFDTLMDYANNFSNRAKELFTNAGQEITNSFSGLTGDTARLGQSARTRAMNQARAGGYGDSSRLGLANQVTGSIAGLQGKNIAKRGENETANLADYNAKEAEAETQRKSATGYKTNIDTQAGELERLGIRDAGTDFASILNNIRNNYSTLAGLQPLNQNALSSYTTDLGGLDNTLNTLGTSLTSSLPTSSTEIASNLSLPSNSIIDLIKQLYE